MDVSSELGAQASSDKQPDAEATAPSRAPTIPSHELFRGTQEVVIVHRQEQYRLRITRQGKLILTK